MTAVAITDTASGKNRETENFPVGSFLIRPDLRGHVHAFYNFARAADDISDHPLLDPAEKIARLDRYAAALQDPHHNDIPCITALRQSLSDSGVSMRHSLDLLTAFKRDATQRRYADWDDLIDYCNYSAAPVGRHVLALHGIGEEAWAGNDALCNTLQIINHIQDCADDYRQLDRVYIPQDMLAACGGQMADLSHRQSSDGLRRTMLAMLDRVDPMLAQARTLPKLVPDIRLKCETSIIGVLAEKLVALLRRSDPLCDNVKLSKVATLGAGIMGVSRAWR